MMAVMGRPRKEINEKQFKNLCAMQCTEEEIAAWFDCSIDTINNWCKQTFGNTFSDTYKVFSANGKISLRRAQMKLAEKSAAMAIFLGKNMLNQTDRVEQTIYEVEDLSPLAEMLRDDVVCQTTNTEENTDE